MRKTLLSLALISAFGASALAAPNPNATACKLIDAMATIARHGADDGNGGVDPQPHKNTVAKKEDPSGDGPGHKSELAKKEDPSGDGPGHKSELAKKEDPSGDGPGHKLELA
ncbi:MAG: hypothetical protein U1E89_12750 [Burkholderiaceae bacterium]